MTQLMIELTKASVQITIWLIRSLFHLIMFIISVVASEKPPSEPPDPRRW